MKEFDLIILGAGAAGFAAAMKADEFGVETLLVNDNAVGLGGTCVNVGCLPTKHLLYVGELLHQANNHGFKGLKSKARLDFTTTIKEKNKLVNKLRKNKYADVLEALPHVTLLEGKVKFKSKNEVNVGGKIFKGKKFIIATGSSAFIPPIKGLDGVDYLTNIEALNLKNKPESMIILGGGALGVEFAQMYSRFGTKVCLLQKADRIVSREEPELTGLLQKYLEKEGIEVCTDVEVKAVREEGKVKIVDVLVNSKEKTYRGEALLIATGRKPNASDLGLDVVGVKVDNHGGVVVDDKMQTTVPHVWAAGDVKGEPMLETIAAREGMIAANNAFSDEKKKMDYGVVPHAVFTDPQLAGVGLTDEQAVQKGIECNCKTVPVELVPKAAAVGDTRGAVKMVIDNKTKEVLGVHMLSSMAADIIHEAAFTIKAQMTVYDVIDTLHIFPTHSEAIKIVAQSFVRDVSRMSCCVE